jgi:hydrogenase nickel incorporation protein HypB
MSRQEIKVYRNLSGANEEWAQKTRELLARTGVTVLNFIGSPGSGKTTLLEGMVSRLGERFRFAVLEGDVETTKDAERLAVLDVPVSQLITGGGCHLNAKMVHQALLDLPLEALDIVIVENVGNLVCPSQFDIGETAKVAVLSVTEGEEKPIKYPMLFREAKAVVLTKTDLLPYIPFSMDACLGYLRQLNGDLPIFQVSSLKGDGMDAWIDWLAAQRVR